MILPGVSGSFILLILGKYEYIMSLITNVTVGNEVRSSIMILGIFLIGAAVGIISFSKFLHWLLGKYNRETILVLAGFIIGSLVKVWPWSDMDTIIKSQYPELLTIEGSLPVEIYINYCTKVDLQIPGAIIFAIIGFCLVTGIELAGKQLSKK
jgi:putative membrane protein